MDFMRDSCRQQYFLFQFIMQQEERQFKGSKQEWHITFILANNTVTLQTVSDLTLDHFSAEVDEQYIKNDKNLDFLFGNPATLFAFLETAFNELTISAGKVTFIVEMPLGKIVKKMELSIPTVKKEVDQNHVRSIRLKKLQAEVQQLRVQNIEIKAKMQQSEEQMQKLTDTFKKFEKTLEQKDEVINSIFVELKEIRQWKEEKEQEEAMKLKRKFTPDSANPHNAKFVQVRANRFKKSGGGSWQVLMCSHPIEKNDLYRYSIRQVKAGTGGSFMYGIGTASIRGVVRAQDHKEFMGYYENTGNLYDRSQSKKGGPRIKDGDIISIEVDTKNWTISWWIEGVKEAELVIHGQLQIKPIYLSIVVYNDEAELQFL